MPAPQRLQAGSLQPSANPVSTFLQFDGNSKPAAPGQPSKLGPVSRVTGIQRGGERDVQGYNPVQELSEALAPLTKLVDTGFKLYASNEYKQGQNEILKAAANVNRDQIQKSFAYAEQNRQVDRENPVAGVLMDEANPFRQAGRVNQASQWVATLAPSQFKAEWQKMGTDLRKLDPSDPAILAVKSKVTNQLTQAFGLDEFSPGFQSYVAPQINRSWEWFETQQFKARVAYDKEVGARQTTDAMVSLLIQPQGPTPEQWMSLIAQNAAQYGLSGEPDKMTREAILATAERLRVMARNKATRQQAGAALIYLSAMPSGLTKSNGDPISVGEAYSVDMLSDQAAISSDFKTIRENQKDAETAALEMDPTFEETIGLDPQSPEWQTRFEEIRANPEYSSLSDADLLELFINQSGQAEQWQSVAFDARATNDFLLEQEEAFGTDWNEAAANRRWQELIRNAPQQVRQDLQRRWIDLRSAKRREQAGELDTSIMNQAIDLKTKALVQQLFPTEGAGLLRWMDENPGGDLVKYLGQVDAQKAEIVAAAQTMYRRQGARAVRAETAAQGGQLTPERQSEIWDKVWADNLSSYVPIKAETEKADTEQSTAPAPTFYSPSQPVPAEATRANVPVYKPTDVTEMLGTLANGGSLPTQVKRSAMSAGQTPGEFMLRQAYLLGLPVPDPMRKKILQQSNRSMGLQQSLVAMAPPGGPLSQSTGVLLNILSGTSPSYFRPTAG